MLLEQVLAQWWHPVVSSEALDLIYPAMRMALYCCIVMTPALLVYLLIVVCLHVALVAAGAIGSKQSPNAGV
jgi:hypothetical protein